MDHPGDHQGIDSEEEAYKKFIVICENGSDSGNEKENSSVKQFKTNRQQFEMMSDFTNGKTNLDLIRGFIEKVSDTAEESVGKVVFDKLWEKLAVDLNQIGPPKRTSMEWRRAWSLYKYNNKRKRSEHRESNAPESNFGKVPESIARKASGESSDREASARKSTGTKFSARKKVRWEVEEILEEIS